MRNSFSSERLHKLFRKERRKITYFKNISGEEKERDYILLKDRIYNASRICPAGENMYWRYSSGFMRKTKVEEIGCTTASENEEYWREYNLRQARSQTSSGSGSAASTRMDMETKIRWNNIHRNYQRTLDN